MHVVLEIINIMKRNTYIYCTYRKYIHYRPICAIESLYVR